MNIYSVLPLSGLSKPCSRRNNINTSSKVYWSTKQLAVGYTQQPLTLPIIYRANKNTGYSPEPRDTRQPIDTDQFTKPSQLERYSYYANQDEFNEIFAAR